VTRDASGLRRACARTVEAHSASTGEDRTANTYNRLGQRATFTDQRGTVHTYDYDKLDEEKGSGTYIART
jgi:hypothetical protein